MAKNREESLYTTSPTAISVVTSAMKTGFIMSGTTLVATAYMIFFFRVTCYLGQPLGALFITYIPPPETVPPKSPTEVKVWQTKVCSIFGGIMGGLMWFAALFIESVSITLEEERTKIAYPWTFWRVIIILAKSGLEALIAVCVTSGAVKMAGLG